MNNKLFFIIFLFFSFNVNAAIIQYEMSGFLEDTYDPFRFGGDRDSRTVGDGTEFIIIAQINETENYFNSPICCLPNSAFYTPSITTLKIGEDIYNGSNIDASLVFSEHTYSSGSIAAYFTIEIRELLYSTNPNPFYFLTTISGNKNLFSNNIFSGPQLFNSENVSISSFGAGGPEYSYNYNTLNYKSSIISTVSEPNIYITIIFSLFFLLRYRKRKVL